MNTAIIILIVMATVGVTFGFILGFANKKFSTEINPLIHLVEDALPKGQCGSCGYAGCLAYAEAVVLNPEVAPNLCIPGKEAVANVVAELTGKAAAKIEPTFAQIRCSGTLDKATLSYNYKGIEDCISANLLQGGPKGCKYGCIGFGTCVKACPFGAMTMSKQGLPIVDLKTCTGCGNCEAVCPKKVIHMIPADGQVEVYCNSMDKGAVARKLCTNACIGCGICVKNCSYGAIKIENNLAVVNSKICTEHCHETTCITKCPTKAIRSIVSELVEKEKVETN